MEIKSTMLFKILVCYILIFVELSNYLSVEGKSQGHGRLVHGKYFGPINETSTFPKEIIYQKIDIGWISQPLDHFNKSDTRKWNQKFARNYTFFQQGGPACIMISGESRMDSRWVVIGQVVEYCRQLNGVLYMLEHRFYGDSHPTADATVESLKYLSIAQTLKDLAKFMEFVKFNEIHKVGKVILFGGSYAGTLAAYFRQRFPNLADISLASSGPIQWRFDFKEYMEVVGKVLKQYDNCYDIVKSGMDEIHKIISNAISTNHDGLINNMLKPLKLCGDLYVKRHLDVMNFYSSISSIFSYYTQYNEEHSTKMSVREICEHAKDSRKMAKQSDFQILADILNLMYAELEFDCFEVSNEDFCNFINQTSWEDDSVAYGSRIWYWQVCNEVASFQTTNSKKQPFLGVTTELFVKQCQCAFGKKFTEKFIQNAVRQHIQLYEGLNALRPRVIYTNGNNDPWSPLGVLRLQQIPNLGANNSPNGNCVILIEGASHCNDLQPDRPFDSLDLQHARNESINCIQNWLKN